MIDLKKLIREVPDYPKPGNLLYDLTTLLKDKAGFAGLHRPDVTSTAKGKRSISWPGSRPADLFLHRLWLFDWEQDLFLSGNPTSCLQRPHQFLMHWNTVGQTGIA